MDDYFYYYMGKDIFFLQGSHSKKRLEYHIRCEDVGLESATRKNPKISLASKQKCNKAQAKSREEHLLNSASYGSKLR